MRIAIGFLAVSFLLLTAVASSLAGEKGRARAKVAAEEAVPATVPLSDDESAVASCKKHIESMLKESAETSFSTGPELRVLKAQDGNFDVSGWVTSKKSSGQIEREDFACHAARFGGGLWTTKTSLSHDR